MSPTLTALPPPIAQSSPRPRRSPCPTDLTRTLVRPAHLRDQYEYPRGRPRAKGYRSGAQPCRFLQYQELLYAQVPCFNSPNSPVASRAWSSSSRSPFFEPIIMVQPAHDRSSYHELTRWELVPRCLE